MWKKNISRRQTERKGQTFTNPRPGQYLTHAPSYITRAVAAMNSCFIWAQKHGIAFSSMKERTRVSKTLYYRGECKQAIQQIAWLEPYTAVSPLLDRIRPLNLIKVCLLHILWPEFLFKLCFIGLVPPNELTHLDTFSAQVRCNLNNSL